ncbi:MAG TPA: hypothetical protein EYN66_02715 [Myxococcales bacterium]|nr:hypothetical protein [Myxococcales bacterium]
MTTSQSHYYHATCDAGLEAVLEAELLELGAEIVTRTKRGITFSGPWELMWAANLQCRTANRILLQLARFRARDRDALYSAVHKLPWGDFMTAEQTLAADTRTFESRLRQPQYVNQVVKDAICDRFRLETRKRPSVDRHNPDIPISVHLANNLCTISLDSSGERLHRRGYRIAAGLAPIRETVAAGLLALAEWSGETSLLDPMCGAGTIAIEAALKARGIAPGLLRLGENRPGFAFARWPSHKETEFDAFVETLKAKQLPSAPVAIRASDRDRQVLKKALHNAERAGVQDDIKFTCKDIADVYAADSEGTVITNPPYGMRLGDRAEVEELYQTLGNTLKHHFHGHTAWVVVGDKVLGGKVGLRPSRRFPVRNGSLDCKLFRFDLYAGSKKAKKQNLED